MKRAISTGLMILAFALSAFATPSTGVRVVKPKQVYLGDPEAFTTAATVSGKKVFHAIPEYQQILDEGLDKNDAKYWVLLKKANVKFNAALKRAAEDQGFDLVAETGAIVAEDEDIANLTQAIIDALED